MADQQAPIDTMMQIYGVNRGQQYGPTQNPPDLSGANGVDWGQIAQAYSLTPQELQQLQMPAPPNGPGLAERLAALRPGIDIGNLHLSTTGRNVQGKLSF